jgi:RHS repeat-associated protein
MRYVYGLDLVNQDRNTGTPSAPVWSTSYFGYDGLGSVRYLLASTISPVTVTDTYTYDAFGNLVSREARRTSDGVMLAYADPAVETAPAGTVHVPNHYRYTGEQWDVDLRMYYLRARYYHPDLGRFWTMDTFEGAQTDPLSLHKYLYAHANPVNMVDPSGHAADGLVGQLNTIAIQLGMFTARWAAKNPKKAFVIVSALSATGIFDGFPPGHPTPFDELATFGRVIRGTGSVVRDTAAVARYQGALSVKAFFSKFSRQDYRKTFLQAFPDLDGKVVVHHAVEQQVLTRYPGVITEAELNSLANLRGVANEINADLHLSRIRGLWDEFYASHATATKEQLLEHAKKIDDLFGSLFDPPVRQ